MISQSSHNGGFCEVFFALTKFEKKPEKGGNFLPISTGAYKGPEKQVFPLEVVSTTVSDGNKRSGFCRYLTGTPGHYRCTCTVRRRCPKGMVVSALRITPACFKERRAKREVSA
jgi:hypothetical protein